MPKEVKWGMRIKLNKESDFVEVGTSVPIGNWVTVGCGDSGSWIKHSLSVEQAKTLARHLSRAIKDAASK